MKNTYLMGIDLGTSSLKTIIINQHGQLISQSSKELKIDTPKPAWAEQDPKLWYYSTLETMRRALAGADMPANAVAAIGLSGQMHGLVCIDNQGEKLRPAIIWPDQRSQKQVVHVNRMFDKEYMGKLTANPVATGFLLASYLWLRENEHKVINNTAWILLPKDYLRYKLTGEIGTEPSDASSSLLYNPLKQSWSNDLLDALEIGLNTLPPIHQSSDIAGFLNADIAEDLGMRKDTPIVVGGSDQACQAIGNGIITPGTISCTIGTGGQILAPINIPIYDRELILHLFSHAFPDTWYLLAATLSAGLSLKWLRDNIFKGKSYAELADLATQIPPCSDGLIFLPYLIGERTPHFDPLARAAFIGLTIRHTEGHLIRATMEGVIFSLRQGLDLITALGIPVQKIIASGGGTYHRLWLQLQADIFKRPIHQTKTIEAAAVGASLLAGIGIGLFPDVSTASQKTLKWEKDVIQPNMENSEVYEGAYSDFCSLYPAMYKSKSSDFKRRFN